MRRGDPRLLETLGRPSRRNGMEVNPYLEKTVIDCSTRGRSRCCMLACLACNSTRAGTTGLQSAARPVESWRSSRASAWVPLAWPGTRPPQQLHLDIRVDDPDAVETEVLAHGGHRLPAERETGFRVFSDPVGHPFCLVFGSSGKD